MARRAASLVRACLLGFLLDSAAAHTDVHPLGKRDSLTVIDPDGDGPLFETPAVGP